jgi:hypothetical protein
MSAQHPPLSLYIKSSDTKHPRRSWAQPLVAVGGSGAREQLALVRPTLGFPLADSRGPLPLQRSLAFMLSCPGRPCFGKMFKNIFQRIFMLTNIFQDFCKNRKWLEKFWHARKAFGKIKHAMKKIKME